MKTVKVLFGVPNEGGTQVDAYDNRLLMMSHLGALQVLSSNQKHEFDGAKYDYPDGEKFEFHQAIVGNVLTPIARQHIADVALNNGFDYLFFVDDDMICPLDLFERLYKHKKDIVGALAFMRFPPHKPVIYKLNQGYDNVEHKSYFISEAMLTYPKDSLVECDAVGFGAVLIDCKVFKKLRSPWFVAATGAGEDIQFCFDARKAGFKVYMDTATKLGHLGPPKVIDEGIYESEENVAELRKKYHQYPINVDGKKYD